MLKHPRMPLMKPARTAGVQRAVSRPSVHVGGVGGEQMSEYRSWTYIMIRFVPRKSNMILERMKIGRFFWVQCVKFIFYLRQWAFFRKVGKAYISLSKVKILTQQRPLLIVLYHLKMFVLAESQNCRIGRSLVPSPGSYSVDAQAHGHRGRHGRISISTLLATTMTILQAVKSKTSICSS